MVKPLCGAEEKVSLWWEKSVPAEGRSLSRRSKVLSRFIYSGWLDGCAGLRSSHLLVLLQKSSLGAGGFVALLKPTTF